MTSLADIENRAGIARVTCGWKKPQLPLDVVRRYWRDVHSPAIARRSGVYDYRHYQFDAVRHDVLPLLAGIEQACPAEAQLMWLSDVRYVDEAALAEFGRSPGDAAKALLLADIELIVERSTTYKAVGDCARTLLDNSGDAMPQGAVSRPTFALFLRRRSAEPQFREFLRGLAARWARTEGVRRVRLSLFDAPDMEAEKKAGYPVKTHPVEQQYQAWIDLSLDDERAAARLLAANVAHEAAEHLTTLHAYPVRVIYTSVYAGRPTIVGLRGFAAYEAIEGLGAANQRNRVLLEWLYGAIARHGAAGTPEDHDL